MIKEVNTRMILEFVYYSLIAFSGKALVPFVIVSLCSDRVVETTYLSSRYLCHVQRVVYKDGNKHILFPPASKNVTVSK